MEFRPDPPTPNAFGARVLEAAKANGFEISGIVDLDLARAAYATHLNAYDVWLERGYQGTMEYLRRGRDRRADPTLLLPQAKSVLVVADPYTKQPQGELDPTRGPRFARYLKGRDYHGRLAERLEALATAVRAELPDSDLLRHKVCVDTSAVLERAWGAIVGLGWIGKNTLLIHPTEGSYFFTGAILWNRASDMPPDPLPDWCGKCERCLKGCPTQALVQPRVLDANQCISYWTLEERGVPSRLSPSEKKLQGLWVAGCDVCQEVCPFNQKPAARELRTDPDPLLVSDWVALQAETEAEYRARVKNTALARVKGPEFRRNLEIALDNFLNRDNPPPV